MSTPTIRPGVTAIWHRRHNGGAAEKIVVIVYGLAGRYAWVRDGERRVRVKCENLTVVSPGGGG